MKPSYGLTDGEIATMIKDSMSYAEQDIQARMLAEQKVEAARVLESLTSALAADAALLSAAERQAIDAAEVRAAAAGDDADAIKEAIKNIDTQTRIRRSPYGSVGPYRAERPIRGRGLKCQNCISAPPDLCPDGIVVEAETGETILDAALRSGIEIEHACEKSCACTTCHCIVREGFDSLAESSEDEDDMLDKAGAGT